MESKDQNIKKKPKKKIPATQLFMQPKVEFS